MKQRAGTEAEDVGVGSRSDCFEEWGKRGACDLGLRAPAYATGDFCE